MPTPELFFSGRISSKKIPLGLFAAFLAAAGATAQKAPDDMILVEGGVFRNTRSNYYEKKDVRPFPYRAKPVTISSFYLGKYEVTQKEWLEVMGRNPSEFKGEKLPVETVSWYDCIEYCNQRSQKEGLKPYYRVDRTKKDPDNENEIDDVKWTVTIDASANGYRLPTEAEWEYAASGGQATKSYTYCGGNDINQVAWFWMNAGDKDLTGNLWSWPMLKQNHNRSHPIGSKAPNELGLYDMSGNVREWCWNWYGESPSNGTEPKASAGGRVWRGGGWLGGDFCCEPSFRAGFEASGKGPDQGLRVCRNP